MNTLGKQLSAYSLVVIALIMVAGLIQGKKLLVMFNIGVSFHYYNSFVPIFLNQETVKYNCYYL